MLSGFVIGRVTPAARSGRAVADYLQRRLIRLYPESWTAVLLAVSASFAAAAMLEGVMQPRVRRWWSGLIVTTRGARGSDVACRVGADVVLAEPRGMKGARGASPRLAAMDMSGP